MEYNLSYFLIVSWSNLKESLEHYKEYLNNGSKKDWDHFLIYRHFGVGLAQILDRELYPSEEKGNQIEALLEEVRIFYDEEDNYLPNTRIFNSDFILNKFFYFKEKLENLLKEYATPERVSEVKDYLTKL